MNILWINGLNYVMVVKKDNLDGMEEQSYEEQWS